MVKSDQNQPQNVRNLPKWISSLGTSRMNSGCQKSGLLKNADTSSRVRNDQIWNSSWKIAPFLQIFMHILFNYCTFSTCFDGCDFAFFLAPNRRPCVSTSPRGRTTVTKVRGHPTAVVAFPIWQMAFSLPETALHTEWQENESGASVHCQSME